METPNIFSVFSSSYRIFSLVPSFVFHFSFSLSLVVSAFSSILSLKIKISVRYLVTISSLKNNRSSGSKFYFMTVNRQCNINLYV